MKTGNFEKGPRWWKKEERFSASDIWFIMIMSLLLYNYQRYQISVRFYESNIYPNRRVTSHYPNLPVFAVFCSLLRFCSLLTCWGQLDPIIRISHLLNIKGQLVLLIPLPGEFLSELSGTSLELLRDHTQSHVGGSILLLAQFKNHVLMQRTWKD